MIRVVFRQYLQVAIAAVASATLASACGVATASALWVLITVVASVSGAVLLRMSPLGRIGWQNRVAAYLLPWGWRLSRGRLVTAAVVSLLVWLAIGAVVFGLELWVREAHATPLGLRILLFASWMVDGGAGLYLLGTLSQYGDTGSPSARRLRSWIRSIVGLIVLSIGLYAGGYAVLALALAGGPPAVLGSCYGLFGLLVLIIGRSARWN